MVEFYEKFKNALDEWNFTTLLDLVDEKDIPSKIKRSIIEQNLQELVKYEKITDDEFKVCLSKLIDEKKKIGNEVITCFTYLKLAKEYGLDERAFRKCEPIKAIRLYIIIIYLFPFNILEQSIDLARFVDGTRKPNVQKFIDQLIKLSPKNQVNDQLLIPTIVYLWYQNSESDESTFEKIKWLWEKSLWRSSEFEKFFIKYIDFQSSLALEGKRSEVDEEFTAVSDWFNTNEKNLCTNTDIKNALKSTEHILDGDISNRLQRIQTRTSNFTFWDYFWLYSWTELNLILNDLIEICVCLKDILLKNNKILDSTITKLENQAFSPVLEYVQLAKFLYRFTDSNYQDASKFFALISGLDSYAKVPPLKYEKNSQSAFTKFRSAQVDLDELKSKQKKINSQKILEIWKIRSVFLKLLPVLQVFLLFVSFSLFLQIEYVSTGRVTNSLAAIIFYFALSFYALHNKNKKAKNLQGNSSSWAKYVGHALLFVTFIPYIDLYKNKLIYYDFFDASGWQLFKQFPTINISLPNIVIIILAVLILLFFLWIFERRKRIDPRIKNLLDGLLGVEFNTIITSEQKQIVIEVFDEFFPATKEKNE